MTPRLRFRLTQFAALLALLFAALPAKAAPVKFDIPAGSASSALALFIKQSGCRVAYSPDQVQGVQTNAVKGDHEPSAALGMLLKDTGLSFTQRDGDWFVVSKNQGTGSVEGQLVPPPGSGKSVQGVTVRVVETGDSTGVDRYGRFRFGDLPSGSYNLAAGGDGFSRLRITDVVVQAGHLVTLGAQEMPIVTRNGEVQMMQEVVVHANKDVEVMEKYVVTGIGGGEKPPPFSGSNFDLPRSIDDIQPYYMWDSHQIENSGAASVQDFFQKMVPMDTNKASFSQNGSSLLTSSNITLNGLGSNSNSTTGTQNILLLLDGLPMPNLSDGATTYQANVNGIPLAAIDHIEVLPSSAAAIYGSNATGGVVNIVLKQDFSGAELGWTYNNTFGTDAPIRNLSLTYGQSLEEGKTSVLIAANIQTNKPLLLQDRTQVFDANFAKYLSLYPGGELAFLGITTSTGAVPTTAPAVWFSTPFVRSANNTPLVSGTSATQLQIPAGYAGYPGSGLGPLQAALGNYNLSRPNASTYLGLYGLRYPLAQGPTDKGIEVTVRRQMAPWLELFAQYQYTSDAQVQLINTSFISGITVPATAPGNPFNQAVTVSSGNPGPMPPQYIEDSGTRRLSGGARVSLPFSWRGELDFTWGMSKLTFLNNGLDSTALQAAVTSGAVNVLRDLSQYPLSFTSFPQYEGLDNNNTLNTVQVKASGPLPKLWAGAPTLAIGAASQRDGAEFGYETVSFPGRITYGASPTSIADEVLAFPGQRQTHDSGYAELQFPLVAKANGIPGIRQLDLQAVGRYDTFEEHTTAPGTEIFEDLVNGTRAYSPALLTGQPEPFTASPTIKYHAATGTIGFKYAPVDGLFFRWSFATGYDVPAYSQLQVPISTGTKNEPSTPASQVNPGVPATSPWSYQAVLDSVLGTTYFIPVKTGGNPNLQPEKSHGIDWGVVFEPAFARGLRIAVDYTKIAKFDDIVTPSAAVLIQYAAQFPGRVQRSSPTGPVTFIDATLLNAPETFTSSYNVEVDYSLKTVRFGSWKLTGIANSWQHYRLQSVLGSAPIEQLGNPYVSVISAVGIGATTASTFGGGAALAKFKGNLALDWSKGPCIGGWAARYTGPYTQGSYYGFNDQGALGPAGYYEGTLNGWISSQIYHDVYVGYRLGKAGASDAWWKRLLANSSVRLTVTNVFDKIPPFDGTSPGTGYSSSYGDIRLSSYILNIKKDW
jgi:outer membrane receptor protein involved in Fe transport